MRYERRVDDVEIDRMSAAAAQLLAEVSGGVVVPGVIDIYNTKTESETLEFRVPRFQAMMGETIPREFIVDMLQRLGCEVSAKEEDTLKVVPPTFRPDLEREIDLYEEVLRLYGMDRIPSTLPGGPGRVGIKTEAQRIMDKINNTLRACGLNETMTYSFADPHELEQLRMPTEGMGIPVELLNPLNAEQSVMRQSIIPGLMRSVATIKSWRSQYPVVRNRRGVLWR